MVIKCAVCRYKRERCMPGCIFFQCLPETEMEKFQTLRTVYGIDQLTKQLISTLNPDMRQEVVDSMHDRARQTLQARRTLQNPNLQQHNQNVQNLETQTAALQTQMEIVMKQRGDLEGVITERNTQIVTLTAQIERQQAEIERLRGRGGNPRVSTSGNS